MSYKDDMRKWVEEHPSATIEEAYNAGYLQCVENWCKGKR